MTDAERRVEYVKEYIALTILLLEMEISGAQEDGALDSNVSECIRTLERMRDAA